MKILNGSMLSFAKRLTDKFSSHRLLCYWKWALLAVIGLIVGSYVVAISFWINLPEDKVKRYIEVKLSENLPKGMKVSIGNLETSINGITLQSLSLVVPELGEDPIRFDQFSVGLISWRIILLKIPFVATISNADSSNIEGSYSLLSKDIAFEVNNLLINNISTVRSAGVLSGSPILGANGVVNIVNSTIEANLNVTSLILNNKHIFFQLFNLPKKISFPSIEVDLDFNEEKKKLEIKSSGSYQGSVVALTKWNQNLTNSDYIINMKGTVSKDIANDDSSAMELFIAPHLNGRKVNLKISFNGLFKNIKIEKTK
ncbi:MAG: hypothetical protein JJV97_02540 [SAR324 cluster bacterium]|nr:hypothetical protein [SAR324 cluster bacterium]